MAKKPRYFDGATNETIEKTIRKWDGILTRAKENHIISSYETHDKDSCGFCNQYDELERGCSECPLRKPWNGVAWCMRRLDECHYSTRKEWVRQLKMFVRILNGELTRRYFCGEK